MASPQPWLTKGPGISTLPWWQLLPEGGSLPAVQWQPVTADGGHCFLISVQHERQEGTSWLPRPTPKTKKSFPDTLRSHQPNLGPTCPFLSQPLARDDSNVFKPRSMRNKSASPLSLRQWGDRVEQMNKQSCLCLQLFLNFSVRE